MPEGVSFCPKCGRNSGVHDSRPREHGYIWRRRHCDHCGERWGTIEIPLERFRRCERVEKTLAKVVSEYSSISAAEVA